MVQRYGNKLYFPTTEKEKDGEQNTGKFAMRNEKLTFRIGIWQQITDTGDLGCVWLDFLERESAFLKEILRSYFSKQFFRRESCLVNFTFDFTF